MNESPFFFANTLVSEDVYSPGQGSKGGHMEPVVANIEALLRFCGEHAPIYLCGCGGTAETLLKYLVSCNIKVGAFVTAQPGKTPLASHDLPILSLDEIPPGEGAGFVLGLGNGNGKGVIKGLRERNFRDFFTLSEYDALALSQKLAVPTLQNFNFEINVVDHCNLSCKMCNHFAQLSEKNFLPVEVFERDLKRFADLSGDAYSAELALVGGEPLLHPEIARSHGGRGGIMHLARKHLPNARITLFTNGIKLRTMGRDFFTACVENRVALRITPYPIDVDYNAIYEMLKENGVEFTAIVNSYDHTIAEKMTGKFPLNPLGTEDARLFPCCCYYNECRTLRNGKLYTCHVMPNFHIINRRFKLNLAVSDDDAAAVLQILRH